MSGRRFNGARRLERMTTRDFRAPISDGSRHGKRLALHSVAAD
jgi:hypothetical protein